MHIVDTTDKTFFPQWISCQSKVKKCSRIIRRYRTPNKEEYLIYPSKCESLLLLMLYHISLSKISYIYCCCYPVTKSYPALYDSMDCSTPGLPVHHQLLEFTQTHVNWVSDAIQPSQSLSSSSPTIFSLSHHQSLFQWVSSSHQVAKVLEFQLQHQSFQWTPRTDLL